MFTWSTSNAAIKLSAKPKQLFSQNSTYMYVHACVTHVLNQKHNACNFQMYFKMVIIFSEARRLAILRGQGIGPGMLT